MIRALLFSFIGFMIALPVLAQSPQIDLNIKEDTTQVGQPLTVRLKVLVPTFMPSPPALPSFEAPNLMVKLNGRATNPTSETIDGQTWSGLIRSYTFYPMVAGTYQLPAQDVVIAYSDPDSSAPITETLQTPAISFSATIPDGAEGLDPLILADELTITQDIQTAEGSLAVGDALTRSLNISVRGTSPLFLPPLLTETSSDGLRAYPQDPKVIESFDRGVLSGTRSEQASYIATQSGLVELPSIQLSWFNLTSRQVETIELDGASFEIEAGPPASTGIDPERVLKIVVFLCLVALALWLFWRFALPPLKTEIARRKAAYLGSEAFAHRRVSQAISHQNVNDTIRTLETWTQMIGPVPTEPARELENAMLSVTRAVYGAERSEGVNNRTRWRALDKAASRTRRAVRSGHQENNGGKLPALNPF